MGKKREAEILKELSKGAIKGAANEIKNMPFTELMKKDEKKKAPSRAAKNELEVVKTDKGYKINATPEEMKNFIDNASALKQQPKKKDTEIKTPASTAAKQIGNFAKNSVLQKPLITNPSQVKNKTLSEKLEEAEVKAPRRNYTELPVIGTTDRKSGKTDYKIDMTEEELGIAIPQLAKKNDAYNSYNKYVKEQRKNNKYWGMDRTQLKNEDHEIRSKVRNGEILPEEARIELNSIAHNMVKHASNDELLEMLEESKNREDATFNLLAGHKNQLSYDENNNLMGSEKALRSYIERELQDREIIKENKKKIKKWQKGLDLENSDYEGYSNVLDSAFKENEAIYHFVNSDKYREAYSHIGEGTNSELFDYKEWGYHLLTDEEKKTFNAVWNQKGQEEARKFLKDMEKELNRRAANEEAQKAAEWAEEHEVLGSIKSIGQRAVSGIGAVENLIEGIIKKDIDPYDSTGRIANTASAARQAISQKIAMGSGGKAGAFLYDVGMSIADFVVSTLLFKGAGSAVGASAKLTNSLATLNMSLSSSADAMIDAANRGGNDWQIALSGIASGVAEFAFEKISIEKLFSDPKLISGKNLRKFIGQQIVTEGSEEGLTEIANIIADAVIMGGRSTNALKIENYMLNGMSYEEASRKVFKENVVQIAMSTAGGMISGAALGGAVGSFNYLGTQSDIKARGNDVLNGKDSANDINLIVEAGLEYEKNSDIYKQAEKIKNKKASGKTISEQDIGTLTYLMENENNDNNADIDEPDVNERTTDNANRVKFLHDAEKNKKTPLPQAIVEGNKTTEALYRDASLGNISLQLAKMGYLESDLKDVAQTLVNYAKGQISAIEVEKILSIPQADAIAQMIEQDINLRELIADPKAQSVASGETLGNLVTKAKASKNEMELFRSEIDLFYAAGKNNISYAEAERMYSAKSLSSDERMAAYYRGLENAQRVYTLKNGNIIEKKMNGNIKGGLLVNDGARRLTNIQKRYLMKLGETLNKTITIQDGLRNDKGQRVSGFINDTAVFIDASVKDPIMWTATHEFSHQMQKLAPKEWAKYRAYVVSVYEGKGTYESALKTYKNAYGNISETELQDEMASDFTEKLFKNEKDLLDFINKARSLATKVKDMWFKVLDKLNISHKEDARSLWEKCYKEATSRANKGESRKSGDVRYKIITMSDGSGRKYVHATQRVIKSENPDMWESEIYDYINNIVREGEDVIIPLDNEESITITEKTAWKTSAQGKIKGNYYLVKGNAAGVIDEIIEVSKSVDSSPPYKDHADGFAKYGFDYRKAYFMDIDGKYYELKLSVGINAEGKEAYDIERIKRMTFPSRGSKAQATKATGKSSSKKTVPQKSGSVNSYFMQNGGNNSQNGRSRISSAAEANRENLNSAAEYARTHAAELAKENARLRKTIEDMHLQLAQNDGSGVNMDVVRDVAKGIKEGYYSKVNGKELQRELAGLYTYMQGRDVDGEEVNRRARAIAEKVVESAIIKNNELYNEYSDLLDRIKNTRIKISDYDKADFKDGFEYYRKHYTMGKLRLTNDGMELDAFWDELAKDYPHLIDENMMGAEERLNRLLEIRDDFQPVYENVYGEQTGEITNKLTEDIKESFYKVPEGTGEKKAVFYDTRSADIKKAMEKMQKQHDEAFRKLDEKYTRLIKRAEAEKAKAEKQRDYYHNRLDKQKILPAIHRNFNYLSKMLLDPTDSRHIPQEMRPMVAEFLRMFKSEAIDSELLGEDKVLSVTATKKAQLYDAYTKIMNELTKDDGVIDESGKSLRIDSSLLAELEVMKNSIPIEENGQFISFADMNAYELNIVSKLLKGIHHAVTVQNNLFAAESRRGVRESGEKLVKDNKEIAKKKGMRKSWGDGKGKVIGTALDWIDEEWNYNELAPIDVFTRMGGVMEELYQAERKGFNKHIENIKESIAKVQSIVEGTDANKWTGNDAKAEEFVTSAGKIKLTRAQVMSLYALSKRKQALNHMLYGGITSDDVKTDKNESLKTINALHITKDDIINIVATMSEDEKRVADAIVNYITVRGAELGNETSMKLYGYEKFGEQWYFPIKVAGEAVTTFYGDRGEGSVRSQGFTKSLAKGAKNPIVITDFFDAAISHMSGMSLYNSVALPMLDMERVLNYSQFSLEEKNEIGDVITPSKFITTARSSLIEAYGAAAEKYIAKLHKDINGQTKNSDGDTLFDNILSKSKKVSVGANLRVLLQQPTSISRAFMFLSPVDFAGAKAGKTTLEEMQNHSMIAYWKSLGFYDIEVGRSMKDIMLGNETALEKIAYGGYGKADDMTWCLIWSAVKNETKRLNPDMDVDSKEFFDKVTERFDYIIDRSQVVDSVFHRTQSMRSKNAFTKTETAFMSEPLKNLNLMRTELFIGRRNGTLKKTVPKIVTVTVLNAAMVATMQSIVDLWRDDDDEWNKGGIKDKLIGLAEKLGKIWGGNFGENLKMWNQVPYVKTFSSMFGKYGVSRFEYSLFEDFSYAIKGMANEKKPLSAKIQSLAKSSAALFGIPVPNMMRDIEGVIKNAYLLFGGNEYAGYNLEKFKTDINNPKNKGKFLKYYERAIENEDYEAAEMIITDYLMVMSNRPGSDNYIKNVISFIEKGKWKSIPILTVHSIIPGVGTGGKKAIKDEHVEAQKEMVRLYKSIGDDNFIFSVPEQKFTASGVDVALTNEEYADMSISVHDKLMSMAFEFINSNGYDKLSDEEKAAGMRTIKDYAVDSSKKDVYDDFELSAWKQDVYDGYTDIQEKITEKVEATKKKNIGAELYDAFRDGEFEDAMEDYIDDGYSREYLVEAAQSGAAQSEEYKAEVRNNKQEKYNLDGLTTEEKNKFTELKNELATYNAKTKYFPEYSASSWASKFYNDQILVNRGEEEHMKMLVKYDAYKVSIGKDGKTPKKAEIETFVRNYTADPILRRSIFRAIAPKNYKNSF